MPRQYQCRGNAFIQHAGQKVVRPWPDRFCRPCVIIAAAATCKEHYLAFVSPIIQATKLRTLSILLNEFIHANQEKIDVGNNHKQGPSSLELGPVSSLLSSYNWIVIIGFTTC